MPSATSLPLSDRRSRRSAQLRERLFHAALTLFAQKGFAETTVEDITNAADVGKGTFFNYFPSKDHILLAFAEMQIGKLQSAIDEARKNDVPTPEFFRSLGRLMTAEPTRNPDIIRAILQAFLASTPVRESMLEFQKRVLSLHSEMIERGQHRGEIRSDLRPIEIAQVFRQTVFGTLLMWSLYADSSLLDRMESSFEILWNGLTPRNNPQPQSVLPMFW